MLGLVELNKTIITTTSAYFEIYKSLRFLGKRKVFSMINNNESYLFPEKENSLDEVQQMKKGLKSRERSNI